MKIGVIALRSASPTLDAGVVARELDLRIGRGSALDPKNEEGVVAVMHKRVDALLDVKLQGLVREFSLDDEESAMARLKGMILGCIKELRHDMAVKEGRDTEVERGTGKGTCFQSDLYPRVAEWARQLGDTADCVTDTPGSAGRKTGDYVIALGEATAAPGRKIVIEAKAEQYSLKKAREELQKAKKNRGAACGVFAFAKGFEPSEESLKASNDERVTASLAVNASDIV